MGCDQGSRADRFSTVFSNFFALRRTTGLAPAEQEQVVGDGAESNPPVHSIHSVIAAAQQLVRPSAFQDDDRPDVAFFYLNQWTEPASLFLSRLGANVVSQNSTVLLNAGQGARGENLQGNLQ